MLDYNVSYRDKDKSIQCIISYKDNDGKWRQKSKQGFRTQKESKPWVKTTVKKLEKTIKTPVEYRGMTLGEFKEIYMNDKRKQSPNTIKANKKTFQKFGTLEDVPLSEISYINVKPCVDKMIDDGLMNSTIKNYLRRFIAVLNHAINKYEIIESNPAKVKDYEFPKQEKTDKIKALNELEVKDLLSGLTGKNYYMSLIAVKCGLRLGEIVGLKDTAFDFKNNMVRVDTQWKLKDGDKKIHGFGDLKSDNSYRSVPIPQKYVEELKNYVKNCIIGIDRRIFPEKKANNASSRLRTNYRKLGYEISIHDLRHTYATTLLFNGLDYKTVAKLMGDTVETIIKTYSHYIEDMKISAQERINKIL